MPNKKKVVYYNMPGDLDYERQLLKEWNIEDLELIQVTGNNIIEDIKDANSLTLEYTSVTADIIEQLPRLKIIALHSIGTNEIDVKSATEQGIYVTNSPGFCAYEVASHAMAFLLNLNRNLITYNQNVKAGIWDNSPGCSELSQLKGKTCGLVSLGSIPQTMIPMLQGFGINIVFYSRSKTQEEAVKLGITKCDTLDELLSLSDIVSLHTPLTDETKNMINEASFSKMKDGVILINTARGELIDEQALIRNLKSGKVSAAGLDVLADETNLDNELITLENVIVTPHVGYLSQESLLESKKIGLEQIVMALSKKQRPTCAVNKENMIAKAHD
ncbi:hydroxyacid dehydrogenase [Marinomonas ushuaiensis DSM 15871]|uniref:Hydroxyacid dehydrogenase n=1 Tax=Marinomonas ushuaiensis DSM 15871 TaxID=1122207 RepID=X7EBN8_9GAMM|nr:C-terminal binding protein [Marinomonas ushuaiensis]ETX12631.1 hydroxyacid dehydrogenase [Marinomonas ushuaiensis DSM 15871]